MSNNESGNATCQDCDGELVYTVEDEKEFIKDFTALINKYNAKGMMQIIAKVCSMTHISLCMHVGKYTRTMVIADVVQRVMEDENGDNPIHVCVMVSAKGADHAH